MPDQMTCTVPPRIWTELPGGTGYVFSEGDAATTVTVWSSQEIEFGAPMRWRPAKEVLTEHALEMSGGGMHVRADGLDEVYPLDQWIAAQQRHGARVHRRRVIVVDDWAKVPHA